MKTARHSWVALFALAILCLPAGGALATDDAEDPWAAYLDYAFVYSSADPAALRARLAEYARQSGISLEEYITDRYDSRSSSSVALDETASRRQAVAFLLRYIESNDPRMLDRSVKAIESVEDPMGRHENRYWFHYILAHEALENGDASEFVEHLLDLWLDVVAPLETPYETLRTLSLSTSPNAGFASALPYVYENLSRIILIRSPQAGLNRGLDRLAALVRLLDDGRVGAHPEVIPPSASSAQYLDRVVRRLNGSESDAGSLTFTLSLFEARKKHDAARSLLASEGLSEATVEAFRRTTTAYQGALDRAETTQGHAAVYTRGLRQLGELYAAKQRLGSEVEVETPFSLGKAIQVYESLYHARDEGWAELGYRTGGRQALEDAMQRLWEEIQETSLNAGAYHLSRAVESSYGSGDHVRNAARTYARYLDFFHHFADGQQGVGIPDSAYFAAYEAAKGFGDAYLAYSGTGSSAAEIELATDRYLLALRLFPFDSELWPSLRSALERRGRVNEYLTLTRPIAHSVTRSRSIESWIEHGEKGSRKVAAMRRAMGDELAIMYLGYAEGSGIEELSNSLSELQSRRAEVARELRKLNAARGKQTASKAAARNSPPASPAPGRGDGSGGLESLDIETLVHRIAQSEAALARLDRQIEARSRALPLYRDAVQQDDLVNELSSQRDHALHALLRRMYDASDPSENDDDRE